MINAAYIYDSKVRWANSIATRLDDSKRGQALGFLRQEDVLTCAGIEECDHAHWLDNEERFKKKFGMGFQEYIQKRNDPSHASYDNDVLEVSANDLKHKASKQLKFSSIQIS